MGHGGDVSGRHRIIGIDEEQPVTRAMSDANVARIGGPNNVAGV